MDAYGTCSWTCGRCGETYSASGVVGDSKVDRWAREHREMHRIEDMTPEDRRVYYETFAVGHARDNRHDPPELSGA
jgi:hypothetical protein